MPYTLRDGVTFCRVGQRHLFLDLHADRYFALSPLAEQQFDALAAGSGQMAEPPRALAHLLTHEPQHVARHVEPCQLPDRPISTALDELASIGPSIHAIGIWLMLCNTAWHLRRKNVRSLIDDIRTRKASGLVPPENSWTCTLQTIWGLKEARILATAENNCLLRSISVARYLVHRGIDATLIIGVKLSPFSAHSWVQANGRLLNDRHEITRIFTPILVI